MVEMLGCQRRTATARFIIYEWVIESVGKERLNLTNLCRFIRSVAIDAKRDLVRVPCHNVNVKVGGAVARGKIELSPFAWSTPGVPELSL